MAKQHTSVIENLARNLIALRDAKDVSQEALALQAGVNRTFVSKIERRIANPSLGTVSALADALGVSVVTLLSPPP